MTSIKWLVASACLIIVQASRDDPGPHIFESNPANYQRGYVMKEVTLFLTPSQIKALETSKGEKEAAQNNNANRYSEQALKKLNAEIKKQLERQHIFINDHTDIQKPEASRPPPPIVEPQNENSQENVVEYQQQWKPIPETQEEKQYFLPNPEINVQDPNTKFPESYSFVKIFTDDKVHETPKLQLFHPIPHLEQDNDEYAHLYEVQRDPINNKEYKLIPYVYLPDNSPGAPKLEEVKEISKWVAGLDKYGTPHAPATFASPQYEDERKENVYNNYKDESHLKYAPSYEDQKNTDEYKNFVLRLEKENALARAEAILKSPSGAARKAVTKVRPVLGNISPIVRHVWKH